jgi:hypothetical protein
MAALVRSAIPWNRISEGLQENLIVV